MLASNVKKNKGSLIIEVLIAISLFMAISTVIAQAVFASFYGSRESKNKITINNLLTEQVVKVRALSDENWNNIGGLSRGTNYYVDDQSGIFSISTGTKSGLINELSYTISFQVGNGQRYVSSSSTEMSLSASTSTREDLSTLFITSTGIYGSSSPIVMKSAITRWRNIICAQNDWSSASSTGAVPCETSSVSSSQKINIEAGSELKLCNGCN